MAGREPLSRPARTGPRPVDVRAVSRRLSYVLRHAPDSAGLRLDDGGWVDVDALLQGLAAAGLPLRRAELDAVVAGNDKQRFAFDPAGTRIRASQGHSVPVDLGLVRLVPPRVLFHCTAVRTLSAVLEQGLRPQRRHAVHLSADGLTARAVGARHGRPGVLEVDAAGLHAAGGVFTRSDNGVWLVASVPPERLRVVEP